ncbi:MAG: hypothetical protein AAGA56_19745, partial [Myxococcota bacterium]
TIRVDAVHETDVSFAGGGGWGEVLAEIASLRDSRDVESDEYLYGFIAPGSAEGSIAGLSRLAIDAGDERSRASIGYGFSGPDDSGRVRRTALETTAHELGHAHGRQHSPGCGADGADADYPHDGGTIGVIGFDSTQTALLIPNTEEGPFDLMTYCDPTWVSDYNYQRFFSRLQSLRPTVTMERRSGPAPRLATNMRQTYDRYLIEVDGSSKRLAPVTTRTRIMGETTQVNALVEGESVPLTGHFYEHDHGGGLMYLPRYTPVPQTVPMSEPPELVQFAVLDETYAFSR